MIIKSFIQMIKSLLPKVLPRHSIEKDEMILKIDFVNDVAEHFGDINLHDQLGRIDSLRNILSNKITALFRYEPKDIVDIWTIAKNYSFYWENIFSEAKEKELGVDPLISAEIIQTFPSERLEYIKWVNEFSFSEMMSDLKTIVLDIISANNNRLCLKNDLELLA